MKSQSKYLRMVLVLSVMVLFSLCAIKVRLTVEGSLKREHRAAKVEEGEVDNEIGEMEKEEEEERERGDHPDEAARFRRLQLQDEKGKIPTDGLEKARQQVKRMKVSATADARQSAGIKPDSWSWMGPGNIGGRIRSIVISPTNTDTMWIGSVSGGIWRTDNGGDSWFPVNDFLANLAVSTMVIDPNSTNLMYAGTGEINGSQNTQGAGVFKSTNYGITWDQRPSTDPAAAPPPGCGAVGNQPCPSSWLYVNRLAISPFNGLTILAATVNGIMRSSNAGNSWQVTQNGGGNLLDIDFHPNGQRAITGYSGGASFSTDAGQSWTAATFTPPITGRVELAYAPSSPNIIYASVNRNNGEVYRSTDGNSTNGSMTFTLVNTTNNFFLGAGNQGEYDNIIWVNPQDPAYVIVGGIDLWRSVNSGTNFTQISDTNDAPALSVHADHHAIVAHPGFNNDTNRTVYFGNDGGIYRADDIALVGLPFPFPSGWTQMNNDLGITQFYGAAGSPATGFIVGGTQDNGTLIYSGATDWVIGRKGDGGFCAADPTFPYLYGEYVYLQIHRSFNGGNFLDIDSGIGDSRNAATANFIAPFILDPNNSNTMLAGGLSLWRSTDVRYFLPSLVPWAAIPKPNTNSSLISAIAVAPGNSNYIVVGHNNGDIYLTSNGTNASPSWTKIDLPAPALPDRFVMRLTIDSTRSPNWIYATFGSFSGDNIYRTTDNGATWTDITGPPMTGLPAVPVRSLVYHPRNPNLLYVGTEVGVFSSDDAGATWEVPQGGPANVSVDELFWMGNDLIAATHGRGLYRASGGIYVDCNWNGPFFGTFDQPYRTVTAAVNALPPASYRIIWLKPCSYNETFTNPPLNKRFELRSLGGTATIGRP